MKANKTFVLLTLLVVVASGMYGVHVGKRASRNLVTLDVRSMEVRAVVKKIERQTGESVSVDKPVQGHVTLRVKNVPLEEVLQIIGEQTSSRAGSIYPLYSSRKSLAALKKTLRGEADPAARGWTNLQSRGFDRGGAFDSAPRGDAGPLQRGVSLKLYNKDVAFATTALNRFYRVRVVPEDGIDQRVNLTLERTPVQKAVAGLARETGRKWTVLYTLQARIESGGPTQFAWRSGDDGSGNAMYNGRPAANPRRSSNPNSDVPLIFACVHSVSTNGGKNVLLADYPVAKL